MKIAKTTLLTLLILMFANSALALGQVIALTGGHSGYSPFWNLDDYLDSDWADTVFSGFGYTALDVQPGGNPGGPFDIDCVDAVNFGNLYEDYYSTDTLVLIFGDQYFANSGYCETDTIAHASPRDDENEYVDPESLVAAWEAIIREVDAEHSGALMVYFTRMPDLTTMEPAQSQIRTLVDTLRGDLGGDSIASDILNLADWPTPFDAAASSYLWGVDDRLKFYTALNATAIDHMSQTIAFKIDWNGSRMENCSNDEDSDGICDPLDNCVEDSNVGQEDADHDGYGDACDFDIDQSCITGSSDTSIVFANKLEASPWSPLELKAQDVDQSGVIGQADVGLIFNKMLTTPGPSGLGCAKCPGNGPEFFQLTCP